MLAGDISLRDYVLNGLADAAAGAAALLAQPSAAEIAKCKWWLGNAFRIAMRIAIIEAAHWELTPKLVAVPAAPVIIDIPISFAQGAREEAYRKAGHNLQPRKGLITCTRCRESACKTNFLKWTRPCRGLAVFEPNGAEGQDVIAPRALPIEAQPAAGKELPTKNGAQAFLERWRAKRFPEREVDLQRKSARLSGEEAPKGIKRKQGPSGELPLRVFFIDDDEDFVDNLPPLDGDTGDTGEAVGKSAEEKGYPDNSGRARGHQAAGAGKERRVEEGGLCLSEAPLQRLERAEGPDSSHCYDAYGGGRWCEEGPEPAKVGALAGGKGEGGLELVDAPPGSSQRKRKLSGEDKARQKRSNVEEQHLEGNATIGGAQGSASSSGAERRRELCQTTGVKEDAGEGNKSVKRKFSEMTAACERSFPGEEPFAQGLALETRAKVAGESPPTQQRQIFAEELEIMWLEEMEAEEKQRLAEEALEIAALFSETCAAQSPVVHGQSGCGQGAPGGEGQNFLHDVEPSEGRSEDNTIVMRRLRAKTSPELRLTREQQASANRNKLKAISRKIQKDEEGAREEDQRQKPKLVSRASAKAIATANRRRAKKSETANKKTAEEEWLRAFRGVAERSLQTCDAAPPWAREICSTHSLFERGGFFACINCGGWAAFKPQKLREACKGRGSMHDAFVLIKKGRIPGKNGTDAKWPNGWCNANAPPPLRRVRQIWSADPR